MQQCALKPRADTSDRRASAPSVFSVKGKPRSATTHACDMFQIWSHRKKRSDIKRKQNHIIATLTTRERLVSRLEILDRVKH